MEPSRGPRAAALDREELALEEPTKDVMGRCSFGARNLAVGRPSGQGRFLLVQ